MKGRSHREIRREVLHLAVPVTISNLLQRMVTAVNIFLVGGLGASAVAAVGIGQLLVFIGLTVIWGIGVGTMVVVAQQWGAARREEAGEAAFHSLLFTFLIAVPFTLIGIFLARGAAQLLGATPEVQALTEKYCRWVFLAFPATAAVHVLTSIMHGAGDTRTPMLIVLVMNLFHIAIAFPLIYGSLGLPALGVQGAAAAVAAAELLGLLLLWWQGWARGYVSRRAWNGASLRPILQVGLPVAIDRIVWQAGQAVYSKILLLYGTAAFAAHQFGVNIESFSFMPGLALGVAAGTVVGQSIGAGDLQRARLGMREANRLGIFFMGGMGILFLLFPEPLLRLLTEDQEVIHLGVLFLWIAAISQIPLAVTLTLQGALRGAGDTRYILLVTVVGIWGARIPVAAASAWWGLSVAYVWWAFLFDWIARMILLHFRSRSSRWERKHVEIGVVGFDPVAGD